MPGQRIAGSVADRYELIEPVGRGGMGTVYRGRDRLLKRDVAVKAVEVPATVPPEERDTHRARVLREARAAAQLAHPNAVTIFDVVEQDQRVYVVMELIDARNLEQMVQQEGPLPPERAARIGLQILAALEAAHDKGVVHRDVKPANVMVKRDETVKLSDFGIATIKDDARLTMTGHVLGSPAYMAPEQAQGGDSSPKTDLWGLGTTLYYAVENRPPFDRGQPISTLTAVVNDEPADMTHRGPLADVIRRLLAKDPDARPSVEDARAMLTRVAHAPTAQPESRVITQRAPVDREPRSWRWLWAVAMVAALAAGAYLVAANLRSGEETGSREAEGRAATERAQDEPEETDEQQAGGGVPAEWVTYENADVGWQISHPPDWDVVPLDGTRIDFRDPGSSTYLRVDWTDQPGESPVAAWETYSQTFAAQHENYEEIRIEDTTYSGYDAAEWEFTYTDGGADLHALNLGFVTGEYGFALFFQTRAGDWDSSQPLFEAFKGSFQV